MLLSVSNRKFKFKLGRFQVVSPDVVSGQPALSFPEYPVLELAEHMASGLMLNMPRSEIFKNADGLLDQAVRQQVVYPIPAVNRLRSLVASVEQADSLTDTVIRNLYKLADLCVNYPEARNLNLEPAWVESLRRLVDRTRDLLREQRGRLRTDVTKDERYIVTENSLIYYKVQAGKFTVRSVEHMFLLYLLGQKNQSDWFREEIGLWNPLENKLYLFRPADLTEDDRNDLTADFARLKF